MLRIISVILTATIGVTMFGSVHAATPPPGHFERSTPRVLGILQLPRQYSVSDRSYLSDFGYYFDFYANREFGIPGQEVNYTLAITNLNKSPISIRYVDVHMFGHKPYALKGFGKFTEDSNSSIVTEDEEAYSAAIVQEDLTIPSAKQKNLNFKVKVPPLNKLPAKKQICLTASSAGINANDPGVYSELCIPIAQNQKQVDQVMTTFAKVYQRTPTAEDRNYWMSRFLKEKWSVGKAESTMKYWKLKEKK